MHSYFERILKYRTVSGVCAASVFFIALGWGFAYLSLRNTSPSIVAQWTNGSQIDRIVAASDVPGFLASIGSVGILFALINWAVALELERRDHFWGKFMAFATGTVAALICVGFSAIIAVN